MGNRSSKENEQLKQFTNRFTVIRQDKLKNVSLLEEKLSGRQCLLKETTFNDKEQFSRALSRAEVKKHTLSGEPHLAALLQYFKTTEDNFCSNFYKLYVLYDYPHKTLEDEILERQECHRKFQQKELWSILASCILGLCHLQNAGVQHESLRSSSVLLTPDGIIKISDPQSTNQQTNYETLLNRRNTPHIYLSPQQCEALANEKTLANNSDPHKSDVFAMGMIMLESGLLSYQDECYREECSKIHWETVNYNLERFGQFYSNELTAMLELMLEQNENERPAWTELQKYVKTGEDSEVSDRIHTPVNQQIEDSVRHEEEPAVVAQKPAAVQVVTRPPTMYEEQHVGNVPVSNAPFVRQLGGGTAVNHMNHQSVNTSYGPQSSIPNSIASNSNYIPTTATSNPNFASFPRTTSYSGAPQISQSIPAAGITRTQLPPHSTAVSSFTDNIVPVAPSHLQVVKPPFRAPLPANLYNTLTITDQNLVEMDPEDLTITRDPLDRSANTITEVRAVPITAVPTTASHSTQMNNTSAVQHTTNFSNGTGGLPQSQYIPNTSYVIQQESAQKYANWQPGVQYGGSQQAAPIYTSSYVPHQVPYIPLTNYTSNLASNLPTFTSSYAASYAPQAAASRPQSNHYEYKAGSNPPASNYANGPAPPMSNPSSAYVPLSSTTNYLPSNINPYDFKFTSLSPPQQPPPRQSNSAMYVEPSDASSHIIADHDVRVEFVKETFKQGSRYEGEKVGGMRHGKGKFFYQDGGLYDGEWNENKMSGHGRLFYQSGGIAYDGEWKDDQFTGFGILYNEYPVHLDQTFDYTNLDLIDEFWTKFQGQFTDDLKQGKGTLYLSNGEYFEGEFDRDAATGEGKFQKKNGEAIRGIWNQNQLERRLN